MERTILFMDNMEDFLEVHSRLLEQRGYQVLRVSTLEEAEEKLLEGRVHLAILDIRMLDEDDEQDISGLLLAQKQQYRQIPKIILTAYPSYEYVRDALGLAPDGLQPAVNFLDKDEGPKALIQAVKEAFRQHVHINWDLRILWDQQKRLSFLHLASLMQPSLSREILVHRAGELEDLFRRLFYRYQQIRIGRLLWQKDRRFCLSILAQSAQGATDSRILVCGERGQFAQELERMQELAPDRIEGTKLDSKMETMHFGAASYVLLNADAETVNPLRNLFQDGKTRPLKRAFDHLLGRTLTSWHQRGQEVNEDRDLMSLYRLRVGLEEKEVSQKAAEARVKALSQAVRPLSAVDVEYDGERLAFHFPSLSPLICPDPVAFVYTPLKQYSKPVVCKISPGQATADNVLVDLRQQTWLTDFAYAGLAPQWWDFVCLEAAIRFDLSQAPDLLAWYEFEECLASPVGLADRLRARDVVADLRTSIALIEQIRRQAGSETGLDPTPYYAGVLAWVLGAITQYDPANLYTQVEQMRGAHLLLAAAVLTHRLGETTAASPLEGTLRLDEDGTVWIEGHHVGLLMGQELELLQCLYERAGRPVGRKTIMESVFNERYHAGDENQESRINSLVRRLRMKIEPDPSRPRYVLTARGVGYRLMKTGGS